MYIGYLSGWRIVRLPRRVGLVARQRRVHRRPGLRTLDEDVGARAEAAGIVQGADPEADQVRPGGDLNVEGGAAVTAEGTGDGMAAVRRLHVAPGLALGDAEAVRRHAQPGGKGAAALALAVAAMAEQRERRLARGFIADGAAQAATGHWR